MYGFIAPFKFENRQTPVACKLNKLNKINRIAPSLAHSFSIVHLQHALPYIRRAFSNCQCHASLFCSLGLQHYVFFISISSAMYQQQLYIFVILCFLLIIIILLPLLYHLLLLRWFTILYLFTFI